MKDAPTLRSPAFWFVAVCVAVPIFAIAAWPLFTGKSFIDWIMTGLFMVALLAGSH